MADKSKNARGGSGAEKFFCSCGGEVKMTNVFLTQGNGKRKLSPVAVCQKCARSERKPSRFK